MTVRSMQHVRQGLCALGVIAAGLVAAPAAAQDPQLEYTITLTNDFLARSIEASVQQQMAEQPELDWDPEQPRVEVWHTNNGYFGVRANMYYDTSIAEVDMTFQLHFDCFYKSPTLSMGAAGFEVETNFPAWVDVSTGGISLIVGEIADVMVNDQDKIIGRIEREVDKKLMEQNGSLDFEFCPRINTESNDLTLHFVTGTECVDGEEILQPCNANENGKGRNSYCINGWWERVNDCGPKHKLTAEVGS